MNHPRATRSRSTRSASIAAGLTLLLVLGTWACSNEPVSPSRSSGPPPGSTSARTDTHTTTVVTRRLLFDRSWKTVENRPDSAPRVHKLRPMKNAKKPGDMRFGLSMPPPCEVTFEVRPGDLGFEDAGGVVGGPLKLFAEAAINHPATRKNDQGAIRFRIEVDGQRVFDEDIPLARSRKDWRHLLGDDGEPGLVVKPGSTVRLRTDLINVDPAQRGAVVAGFSTLELRRSRTKPLRKVSAKAPNLVLIVMDTLRADRLGCYGYELPTTPNLDTLAERGTLYEAAYGTSSWTWPSTASILTGLWPETHGVTSIRSCYLAGGLETVPEVLSSRGYRTAAFTCNPLIVRDKNFDQGFDEFDDGNIPGIFERGFTNTGRIQDDVFGWLDANHSSRFFLYLHLVDTHWRYDHVPEAGELLAHLEEPAEYPEGGLAAYQDTLLKAGGPVGCGHAPLEQYVSPEHQAWLKAQYDAAVRSADEHVGRVLGKLSELGLDQNTIVVFTSDHGEELFDHGMPAHGFALYEEHVRVPLIIAGPGVASGERVGVPVSNRHIAPTLAWLGGSELTSVQAPINLLDSASIEQRPIFFSTENGLWCGQTPLPVYGVRDGDAVWIHYLGAKPWGAEEDTTPPPGEGRVLFDLAQDPRQQVSLWEDRPELATRLSTTLSDHVQRATAARAFGAVAADDSTMQMLRDVGYVGEDEATPTSEPGSDPGRE